MYTSVLNCKTGKVTRKKLSPEEVAYREKMAEEHRKMKEESAKMEYARQRAKSYPDIGNQLDIIWRYLAEKEDLPDEAIQMLNSIDKVKRDFPKPL